ncbi:MAG: methionyl-tRNA formyltransferase [Halanaerobiaceae bacterium]
MKIVFFGSPDFAVPSLVNLTENNEIEVELVVTQPPRKKGRGQKLSSTPVGQKAKEFGLNLLEVPDINKDEIKEKLAAIKADYFVVVAFGQIFTQEVLDIPKKEPINLHASLLPRYRGASPIHQAIINGDDKTGVTTMLISRELDQGDILLQKELVIEESDTAGKLHDKLAEIGADLLVKTLLEMESGQIEPESQNDSLANYAPQLSKKDGLINFNKSNREVFNFIRGNNPWPGAYTFYQAKKLKVWNSEIVDINHNSVPGEILSVDLDQGLLIATANGAINLTEVQLPGSKRMSARDFICGYQPEAGEILGK